MHHLMSLKVKGYANAVIKALYEYSVGVLLFGSFFFSVISPASIAKPIEILLGTTLSLKAIALYLVVLNITFIVLFSCQKKMVFNQDFESFVQTFPISKAADCLASISVLFVSNHFLWFFLLLGSYLAFCFESKVMVVCETLYLMGSLLVMQLCLHEKNTTKFILVLLSNVVFIFSKRFFVIEWFDAALIALTVAVLAVGFSNIKKLSFAAKRRSLTHVTHTEN